MVNNSLDLREAQACGSGQESCDTRLCISHNLQVYDENRDTPGKVLAYYVSFCILVPIPTSDKCEALPVTWHGILQPTRNIHSRS
jgi:hypothetical protein